MKVVLRYGSEGLPVDLPETPGFAGVLEPSSPPALADPAAEVARRLGEPLASPPLADLARGRRSACVVVRDVTRPVPNALLLPPLLHTLEEAGVPREGILLLVATGMHRPTAPGELPGLLGPEVLGRYRVADHDGRRPEDLVEVGRLGEGVPALVNRRYVEAELKVLTGFVEPHMWAGYSGGRKSILPGISGLETLQFMHGPEMVAHPGCEYGRLEGNPFHEAGLRVMALAGADFVVNVTQDSARRVTGVFAGHPVEAHLAGCRFLEPHCVRELDAPLDFAVTTNAGAPLDCNLYQTTKGITGAAAAVRPGGDILVASRCAEGAGSPEYGRLLADAPSPTALLESLHRHEAFVPDQWCAQETCQVLLDRNVWVYSEGFSAEELARFHLRKADDVAGWVRDRLARHGPQARWAVVPEGPMVILRVAGDDGR